jgi:hypothetical protein
MEEIKKSRKSRNGRKDGGNRMHEDAETQTPAKLNYDHCVVYTCVHQYGNARVP